MSNLSSPWTDDNVAALRRLWARGYSCSDIAAALRCGLTRNAVIGKAARLGLEPRKASFAFRTPKPKQPRPLTDRRTIGAAIKSLNRGASGPPPRRAPAPEVADVDIPAAQRRTLLQLTAHTCRWPVGDPGEAGFYFCGAEPVAERPYCLAHCRVAYVGMPDGRGRRVFLEYRA